MDHTIAALLCAVTMAFIQFSLGSVDTSALTSTTSKVIADVSRAYTSAHSCSSASATSYGGWAAAHASDNSAVIRAAASSCADSITQAFAAAGAGCSATDVTAFVYAAATACANSTVSLRTRSLARAASAGGSRTRAVAQSCGYSSAHTGAIATSMAQAMARGYAAATGQPCAAPSGPQADAVLQAVARAMTSGMAGTFAHAATQGYGSAAAAARAMFTADVATYAKAVSQIMAHTCASCARPAAAAPAAGNAGSKPAAAAAPDSDDDYAGKCAYCSVGLTTGDSAGTDTMATAAAGSVALAHAISDAMSAVCHGRVTVQVAVDATLQAIADVVVQITAKAYAWSRASGKNAMACGNAYVKGTVFALADAYGSVVAEAVAAAFDMADCAAEAFSWVKADTFSRISEEHVVKAVQQACTHAQDGYVSYRQASEYVHALLADHHADALSDAMSFVLTRCGCAGDGYCCNCQHRSPQCSLPALAATR